MHFLAFLKYLRVQAHVLKNFERQQQHHVFKVHMNHMNNKSDRIEMNGIRMA